MRSTLIWLQFYIASLFAFNHSNIQPYRGFDHCLTNCLTGFECRRSGILVGSRLRLLVQGSVREVQEFRSAKGVQHHDVHALAFYLRLFCLLLSIPAIILCAISAAFDIVSEDSFIVAPYLIGTACFLNSIHALALHLPSFNQLGCSSRVQRHTFPRIDALVVSTCCERIWARWHPVDPMSRGTT
jgi:hypothetical protein